MPSKQSLTNAFRLPNKQGSDFSVDHHVNTANLVPNLMPQIGQDGYVPHVVKPHLPPSDMASVKALKNQYDPLPWSDFFDATEMIED